MRASLESRRLVAPTLRQVSPTDSVCARCSWPWSFADPHITDLDKGDGCFALCTQCWAELGDPAKRLPFYQNVRANSWPDKTAKQIERAVMADTGRTR